MNDSYKSAGVDVHAGYRAVELMKEHVKKTHIPGVISDIGGFGGLFEIGTGFQNPVLVSGTDGVGTKLKIAFVMDKHDTVGQDCVAMCVNDIVCSGAKPLFFLDYIAVGKNVPEKVASIVKGVADGCVLANCALIGGETAEMPGFYPENEYDLAGFSVGIVDKSKIIDGSTICAGDVLIGIPSSGIHSNGYSLVRKTFALNDDSSYSVLSRKYDELQKTLGEELLTPTKIYVKPIQSLLQKCEIKAMSHITGGGFIENIPRMLKKGLSARIQINQVPVLPIFDILAKEGNIPKADMFNTFNMGIGLVMAVAKENADAVITELHEIGEQGIIIGDVIESGDGVQLI